MLCQATRNPWHWSPYPWETGETGRPEPMKTATDTTSLQRLLQDSFVSGSQVNHCRHVVMPACDEAPRGKARPGEVLRTDAVEQHEGEAAVSLQRMGVNPFF